MLRVLFWLALSLGCSTLAAERVFDFAGTPTNQTPAGFTSFVLGPGKPGNWQVIQDDSAAGQTASNNVSQPKFVLAQLARQAQDNHYPVLVYDQEAFGDFRLTTRFKIVGGALDQAAGIVFRFQNESNFYLIRASALDNSFRYFKVENAVVKPPIGPELKVTKGEWHELVVQCDGTRILCALDGNEAVKLIDNNTRKAGKIGFWTKSDSVAYFADTKINYTPHQSLAKALIRDALAEYPRVLGIRISAARSAGEAPTVIASKDEKEIGQPVSKRERDVLEQGNNSISRDKEAFHVVLPLRDRNGDPIAAVLIDLKAFPGQTEDNALLRAKPIVSQMQPRVLSLDALLE
jgi:hypothetical protein